MNPPNDQKSLRDEFAMAALPMLGPIAEALRNEYLKHGQLDSEDTRELANTVYLIADAMLAARKK